MGCAGRVESSKAGSSGWAGSGGSVDRPAATIAAISSRRAEGLADEAVGAAVEGRPLERVGPAHGQDARRPGRIARRPAMKRDAAIDLGQARIDDDDVGVMLGWRGRARGRAGRQLPTTMHWPPMASRPGQALAHPVVRIDDEDAERPSARGRGVRHGPMVRPRRPSRPEATFAGGRARRNDRSRLRHPSRIDGVLRGSRGRWRHRPCRRAAGRQARRGPNARPRPWCPRPAGSRTRTSAPMRSARARIPASPRWPSGTVAGSKPLPSSSTRSRTPPPSLADLDPDLAGRGVLDDVVERLLGDAVEHLLGRQRQAFRRGRSRRRPAGRAGPAARALWVLSARTRPSCSRLPGRSSKISARISASASRWSSRSWTSWSRRGVRVRLEQHLDGARHERHREQRLGDRVVQLAGEVGALLAGRQLPGLAPQLALEADLVAHVARGALDPGEPAVAVGRRRRGRRPGSAGRRGPRRTRAAWSSRSGSATSASQRSPASGRSSDSTSVPRSAADELRRV